MAWTTANLLTAVRRRCRIPDGASAFSNAELLAIADEETLHTLLPVLRMVRQNYYVRVEDTAVVADQEAYRIPSRAQGGTIRDVTYLDPDGDEFEINPVSLEEYPALTRGTPVYWPNRRAHAIQGDQLLIRPIPTTATGSIRMPVPPAA